MNPHEKLKAWREARKISLASMAAILGCNFTSLCHIEQGRRKPVRRVAHRIEVVTEEIRMIDWDDDAVAHGA